MLWVFSAVRLAWDYCLLLILTIVNLFLSVDLSSFVSIHPARVGHPCAFRTEWLFFPSWALLSQGFGPLANVDRCLMRDAALPVWAGLCCTSLTRGPGWNALQSWQSKIHPTRRLSPDGWWYKGQTLLLSPHPSRRKDAWHPPMEWTASSISLQTW